MKKMGNYVVKIKRTAYGGKHPYPKKWHFVACINQRSAPLCTGEFFGFAEKNNDFKTKHGRITCPDCIKVIKNYKKIKI